MKFRIIFSVSNYFYYQIEVGSDITNELSCFRCLKNSSETLSLSFATVSPIN